jgi:hypothetical protein
MRNDPIEFADSESFLSGIMASIKSMDACDFMIPTDANVGLGNNKPSFVPYSSDKKGKAEQQKKRKSLKGQTKTQKPRKNKKGATLKLDSVVSGEDYTVFKPTCCRTIPFEEVKKMQCYLSTKNTSSGTDGCPSFRHNAPARKVLIRKIEDKSNASNRAARASQRRMLKSISSLGESAKTIDRLAGRDREEQLRFGRSRIHGWGVFATG